MGLAAFSLTNAGHGGRLNVTVQLFRNQLSGAIESGTPIMRWGDDGAIRRVGVTGAVRQEENEEGNVLEEGNRRCAEVKGGAPSLAGPCC